MKKYLLKKHINFKCNHDFSAKENCPFCMVGMIQACKNCKAIIHTSPSCTRFSHHRGKHPLPDSPRTLMRDKSRSTLSGIPNNLSLDNLDKCEFLSREEKTHFKKLLTKHQANQQSSKKFKFRKKSVEEYANNSSVNFQTQLEQRLIDAYTNKKTGVKYTNYEKILVNSKDILRQKFYFDLAYDMYGEIAHAIIFALAGGMVVITTKSAIIKDKRDENGAKKLYNMLVKLFQCTGYEIIVNKQIMLESKLKKNIKKISRADAHFFSLKHGGAEAFHKFPAKISMIINFPQKFPKANLPMKDKFKLAYINSVKPMTFKAQKNGQNEGNEDLCLAFWIRNSKHNAPKNLPDAVFQGVCNSILSILNNNINQIKFIFFGDKINNDIINSRTELRKLLLENGITFIYYDYTEIYKKFHKDKTQTLDYFEQICGYRAVIETHKPVCIIGAEAGNLDLFTLVGCPVISIELITHRPNQLKDALKKDRIGQLTTLLPEYWQLVNYGLNKDNFNIKDFNQFEVDITHAIIYYIQRAKQKPYIDHEKIN